MAHHNSIQYNHFLQKKKKEKIGGVVFIRHTNKSRNKEKFCEVKSAVKSETDLAYMLANV